MNGKYLATNIDQLKEIADGKVLRKLNNILDDLNESRAESSKGKLVAYEIEGDNDSAFLNVFCLIKSENGFFYRSFELFKKRNKVEDELLSSAMYGLGFSDWHLDHFLDLRNLYLESKN